MSLTAETCCALHVEGPRGACCDADDCGPCCESCPTCPSTQPARGARRRSERGSADGGGLVVSVVVVLAVIVAMRVAFHTDPIAWLNAAADWCVHGIYHLFPDTRGGFVS